MTFWLVALLVLHLILCAALRMLVRLGLVPLEGRLLAFMCLVPVWGPASVALSWACKALWGERLKGPTLEALRNNEAIHRSLLVEGREGDAGTVPLEEALIVDGPADRRRLMLSILNDDPEDYISLLQGASLNDDPEVAHYASSAMSQISKEADVKLQRLEQAFAADPDDPESLDAYCDYLGQYLASGLTEGKAADLQRAQYLRLLRRRLEASDDPALLCRAARASLDMGDLDGAHGLIDRLMEKDAASEEPWLLRLDEAALAGDGVLVASTLGQIRSRGVYLSSRGREAVAFWAADGGSL